MKESGLMRENEYFLRKPSLNVFNVSACAVPFAVNTCRVLLLSKGVSLWYNQDSAAHININAVIKMVKFNNKLLYDVKVTTRHKSYFIFRYKATQSKCATDGYFDTFEKRSKVVTFVESDETRNYY